MRTTFDPRAAFPHFYANPGVLALADTPRWTVSGQIGDDLSKRKAPVDIRELLATGRLRGAWAADETCLLTLDELTTAVPVAANCAFHLRAQIDTAMLIDIEKTCPPAIAAGLLGLPVEEILYSELSMSGKGYHLLTRTPANFWDFPNAATRTVLREEHGWYEILLEHWITFTRQPVPAGVPDPVLRAQVPAGHRFASVAELYARLAQRAPEQSASSRSITLRSQTPLIDHADRIVDLALEGFRPKSPAQFNGDLSRWEFSVLAGLYSRLLPVIAEHADTTGHGYSFSDQAWLLYQAATRILPHRSKHDETRNGRAFLLDRAAALIAQREENRRRQRGQ